MSIFQKVNETNAWTKSLICSITIQNCLHKLTRCQLIYQFLMLNSRQIQKNLASNLNHPAAASRSRSKSIYRGNQLHTTSMHLKIQCDMSPEKLNQTKDYIKQSKPLFKQNRAQKLKDSLKIVEGTHSGKKVIRQQNIDKPIKSLFLQTRQLETERFLKQSTNTHLQMRKQSSFRPQKNTIVLGSNNISKNFQVNPNPITTVSAQRSIKKQSSNQTQSEQEKVIMSEHELRQLFLNMSKLQQQNNKLRKQIKILMEFPKSSAARALSFNFYKQ